MQVMHDIETMGVSVNAPIISIGAVLFDVGGIHGEFYCRPAWEGPIEHDTVRWWLKQEEEARFAILEPPTDPLEFCLLDYADFRGGIPAWGNGAAFDNAILAHQFRAHGLKWDHRLDRCYRTFRSVCPEVEPPVFSGAKHNALDDARFQAMHLIEICKHLGITL